MMFFYRIPFMILSLFLILNYQAKAGHIIGGDMTYRCLGDQRYVIRLDIYIDCNCTNCASFDEFGYFGFYRCGGNSNIDCESLNQLNRISTLEIQIADIESVPAPDYECISNPPNLCVLKGSYEFVLGLPQSDASYYIMYQRCCRNVTINNIIDPGKAGATYFVEITPEAQASCNSSAVFREFPPTVICSGFPLTFDHSATDIDGDSISYRFCAPLLGAGIDGGPDRPGLDQNTCTGIIPRPACPPPYLDITFRDPFTALNPLGGDPQVTINQETGLITGTPNIIGQFVVGICADEFKDGQLVNTLRRDFQFNTAACDANVFAGVDAETIVDGRQFFLRSCGDNSVTFINQSGQERFIREYSWEFPEGQPAFSNDRNATITFPDVGSYQGLLVINPGLPCSDSAEVFIDIFPEINADFEFEYDTCISGPVDFIDLSFSGSGTITNWNWNFDDSNTSTSQNPTHLYGVPGIFDVNLQIRDINDCEDDITIPVTYFPVPEEVIVGPDRQEACQPAPISFFNLSTPIDDTYDVIWTFGDGNTGEGVTVEHTYEEPGLYTVTVDITSPIGCKTSASFPSVVNILPSPIADFNYNPTTLSNFNKTVNFTDQSRRGASFWEWDFGGVGETRLKDPVFTFPDTGIYSVQLIVTHPSGCMDTIIQLLDVEPQVRYFLPNAFTPNNDGLNDDFRGTGSFQYMNDFTLSIWSRWGEMLFETKDPNQGWNGQKYNNGSLAPPGVYVCVVRYTDARGREKEIKGFATLVQ